MAERAQGGADENVVTLLKEQHRQIRELFEQVETAEGEGRREAFRKLVRLLAVHETAEEEVVHPTARRAFESGDRVVADRLREEREAKEVLSELDGMDVDDPDFMPTLRALRDDVLAHADAEERLEFNRLQEQTEQRTLARMAKAVRAAEAMAPTHPHPGVESATKNIVLGPLAAVVDRTRDAVRKAMGDRH
ncbi:hemerythrin domain-containing protein [Streptomyces sp. SCA3-4]|uniref:hemerythrin domain-containing protein n=1 Tax=Streptomyces sichuanensis TaxID=2871810 RepID=UPI001CE37AE7|nr:hemerythrin domain-containing protein [Streptomyces sichuanensis]MCA6093848.1 hemerythrin domain-containing protein [Streptomyces sichuanensis]